MPTRNVNLTEELDNFVLAKIDSGRYENASEAFQINKPPAYSCSRS
jgi:Arc/MetJ-type ribon-helix-helix transcriptional regulator